MSQEVSPATESLSRSEQAAVELWEGIDDRTVRSGLPALPERTIGMTLERYREDPLGAAIAADITHVLVAELPLDGTLTDDETGPVDSLVQILRDDGLEGVSIVEIADVLGINLDHGNLLGIMKIHEALSDVATGNRDLLRHIFARQDVLTEEEVEDHRQHELSRAGEDWDESEDPDAAVLGRDQDEEADEAPAEPTSIPTTTVVDESGEEFEL